MADRRRVMAAISNASAEFAVGHARRIYAAPEGLSFEQAVCLPVALQTMHGRLPVDKVYPLEQAADAFALMARNEHFGKIVLTNT